MAVFYAHTFLGTEGTEVPDPFRVTEGTEVPDPLPATGLAA